MLVSLILFELIKIFVNDYYFSKIEVEGFFFLILFKVLGRFCLF